MDPTSVETLKLRIQSFPSFSELAKLNDDIVERKGWEGKSLTAFYRMALVVFRGLLEDDQMDCWYVSVDLKSILLIFCRKAHCRYLRYLLRHSFDEEKLANLMATYWQWKKLFISIYKDATIKQTNAVNKKSMQFLNLHIGEHWPQMIKQFGCPAEYSTQHWESLHQIVKAKEKNTNHALPAQDIARAIVEKHCAQLKFGNLQVMTADFV